jgi:serine/threonine protein kinase
MQRSPVSAWQELSELYEQADGLEGAALQAWLARPQIAGHAQRSALERMLAAREHLRDSDFLNAPPRLDRAVVAAPVEPGTHAGATIGPYRLLAPLGSGGMAEVWLAERSDGSFQRRVAIKLMFRQVGGAARDGVAQRFERERDILASLDHPHIATLHDAGVTPAGQPWLALEYVEGEPLTDWCDHARLGIVERVRLFRQVLQAVQHAHAQLVMHRDLKPANILVATGGQVHLLDFGIAKLLEPGAGARADTELTRAAGRPMTPLYASPEQLRGEPLTIACDVYALGVVLYELLCGERPYEIESGAAARLEQAILETDPRAPSRRNLSEAAAAARGTTVPALRKALRGDLDAIVLQALAKQPQRRYASAEAMLADIDRWLDGEPVKAHAPSAVYRWGKFVRRHHVGVATGSVAVLMLAAVATDAVIQRQQAQREASRAVAARDFMIDMFKRADMAKSRGADVTAREMLNDGRKEVLQRLSGQFRLQAELLKAIGSIQYEMGEYATADDTFQQATLLQERLGDHDGLADMLFGHAQVAYQLGDFERVLRLIHRARAESAAGGGDAALDSRLDWVQGWVHSRRDELDQAQVLFDRSLGTAQRVFGPHHLSTIEVMQGLTMLAAQRRDYATALAIQDDIAGRLPMASQLTPREIAQIQFKRVYTLLQAGRWHEAYGHAEAAGRACAAAVGPGDETCRELAIRKVMAALRLGRVESVRSDLPALEAIAADDHAPDLQARATLWLCRARAALDGTRVDPLLAQRLVRIGTSGTELILSADTKVGALLALADASLRVDQPREARQWVDRALGSVHASGAAASTRAWARHIEGVALLAEGEFEAALVALRRSEREYEQVLGAAHPQALAYSLNQAVALEALGRPAAARAVIERARPVLRIALGEDAPPYQAMLALERRLHAAKPSGARGDAPGLAGKSPSPLFI